MPTMKRAVSPSAKPKHVGARVALGRPGTPSSIVVWSPRNGITRTAHPVGPQSARVGWRRRRAHDRRTSGSASRSSAHEHARPSVDTENALWAFCVPTISTW